MSNLIEFLTSKEVILVYILAGVAVAIALLFYIIEKTYFKRQQKQNTKELFRLTEKMATKEETGNVVVEPAVFQRPELLEVTSVLQVVKPKFESVNEEKVAPPEISIPEMKEEIKPSIAFVTPEVIETPVIEEVREEPSVVEPEVMETLEENIVTKIITDEDKQVEEIIEYAAVEPDKTAAQAELEKLTEELRAKEEENKNIVLTDFELNQEENAIISLDELMSKGNTLYEANEFVQYEDEGDEPISIQDLEVRMSRIKEDALLLEVSIDKQEEPELEIIGEPIIKNIDTTHNLVVETENMVKVETESSNKMTIDDFYSIGKETSYGANTNFKNSPFISPIYGIEEKVSSVDANLELENTANYDKLDEEIRKTNKFLITLKELQKKLD